MESGNTPSKRNWWQGSDVPNWLQVVIGIVALLVGLFGGSKVLAPPGKTVTVTQTVTTQPPLVEGGKAYLSHMQPAGGDTPTPGDHHIGDQDFPYSISYLNTQSNQSSSSTCQKSGAFTCQATDYNIASHGYHQFSAMLGVTGCETDTAEWSVRVDGVVIRTGTIPVDNSPHKVSFEIPRGNDLELLVSTSAFSGAACGEVNIIWGNAELS